MQNLTEKTASPQPGLVISYFGNSVAVETVDGQVVSCHLRRNQVLPVVGDQVLWERQADDTGLIAQILPRRSQLARSDGHGHMKLIATNIDAIVIVMAPPPIFSEYLVDRYLIAAELLSIQPIIVLNKSDLLDKIGHQAVMERLIPYKKIPYPVIFSSIFLEAGLQTLSAALKNKTVVLVGPSGVGKSSLIAALSGQRIMVGEVTAKGAGRHTTTATRLYHLPQGGDVIDSPGVREFSLWPVTQQEILQGFREFRLFTRQCKFRDCQHLAEPDCAVLKAVFDGSISEKRMQSYQELMKTVKKHK